MSEGEGIDHLIRDLERRIVRLEEHARLSDNQVCGIRLGWQLVESFVAWLMNIYRPRKIVHHARYRDVSLADMIKPFYGQSEQPSILWFCDVLWFQSSDFSMYHQIVCKMENTISKGFQLIGYHAPLMLYTPSLYTSNSIQHPLSYRSHSLGSGWHFDIPLFIPDPDKAK